MSARAVCITGVAGFLGSSLARRLMGEGWSVSGLDNFSHGGPPRVAELAKQGDFRFLEGDVRDAGAMAKAVSGCRHVVHLAEVKIPRYGHALETLEVNVSGVEVALEAARAAGAAFVLGSTDEVYGKNPDATLNEEGALVMGRTDSSRWSLGVSKLMAEQLALAFRDEYQVPVTILRFFGLYGPGQATDWTGGPQAVFVTNALQGKPLPIHGDGLQVRTFTHIDDAVRGAMLALETPYARGEIVNLAGRDHVNIINLAYMIWRLSRNPAKPALEFTPYSDFTRNYEDVPHRIADVTKARYLLGFEPQVPLEAGFAATVEWQSRALALPLGPLV